MHLHQVCATVQHMLLRRHGCWRHLACECSCSAAVQKATVSGKTEFPAKYGLGHMMLVKGSAMQITPTWLANLCRYCTATSIALLSMIFILVPTLRDVWYRWVQGRAQWRLLLVDDQQQSFVHLLVTTGFSILPCMAFISRHVIDVETLHGSAVDDL